MKETHTSQKHNKYKINLNFLKVISVSFNEFWRRVKIGVKKLDKKLKSSILTTYFKCLDFFKYSNKNISRNLRALKKTFNFAHLKSGNFLKGKAMFSKQFLRDPFTSARFCMAALATTLIVVALTACGGGGGGGAAPSGGGVAPVDPETTTVIITPTIYTAATLCASGPALTSTVNQATADALVPDSCPTVSTVGVGVSIGEGNMLTITGLPVGVSVSGSTVTMVSGGSTLVFLNGALISGTPLSNATYTFSGAVIKLTNAPAITIAGTTVSPVIATTCTAPAMLTTANTCISPPAATGYTWNSVVKVWVADRGVQINSFNTLPAICLNAGDACYVAKAADGTIKFQQGPAGVMSANFRNSDGSLNTYPINTSDGTPNNVATLLTAGASTSNWDYSVGTINGFETKRTSDGACFLYSFTTLWGNSSVTCSF